MLLSLSAEQFYDISNPHLEYFPVVNQRVFAIGDKEDGVTAPEIESQQVQESEARGAGEFGLKQILNVDFRNTYIKFIHRILFVKQEGGFLSLTEKQKLQLAYYLQLQDRIEEAISVYKQVNLPKLHQNGNAHAC